MPFDTALILGVIQGVTEFIPVSSTGHLILGRELFAVADSQALAFDAVLQMATAFAIFAYFWPSLRAFFSGERDTVAGTNISLTWKTVGIVALATLPAIAIGLSVESLARGVFRSPTVVAGALVIGAGLLSLAEYASQKAAKKNEDREEEKEDGELTIGRAVVVGFYQCLALVPGMSRSGSTISGGILANLDRQTATSFSFLLGLPILLGAGGRELFRLAASGALTTLGWPLLAASVAAFMSGLAAMHILMQFIKNHSLNWFAAYRVILAVAVLFLI